MSEKDKQVKSIVLLEGHVRWIMERETPEERLAAWETLAAIAFPENPYELPYTPPQKPFDGSRLSPCDRVRRDTYNMLADYINSRMWEADCSGKNPKKVMAGRIGAAVRHGKYGSSSTSSEDYDVEKEEQTLDAPIADKPEHIQKEEQIEKRITMTPLDMTAEESGYFSEQYRKIEPTLTDRDKKKIADWHKRIPNAAALKEYLERNWVFQNKTLVCSEQFCQYAYNKLAREGNWVSTRDKHALSNISSAIHFIALDFDKKIHEIKRAEAEEKRKDIESEFETKASLASQMTNEEVADMQRISSRKAEREAMEKILRGEL